ncbi:palmitoyltransferase [Schizosaccharomyces japonicus yFS275]|uniref:Palmitoyltransferase n=1 Tax=Schizosaccharomyces japonicus (strain yFS275 / FY16936) TaxID=402676 RepID=B6JWX0_SCHJY|nr:palmitoyltransferase [Schizosaccharomyces japonicus yFS275]EEB05871.1 palmitoyltransferase [Schizosaccharomyces japonicus yFS275]
MTSLQIYVICCLSFSAFLFVILFGQIPAFHHGPIGWLNRLLLVHIPHLFSVLDQNLFRGILTRVFRRVHNYLWNERNPLVIVFYLTLLVAGAYAFFHNGQEITSQWGFFTWTYILICLSLPCISLFLASTSNPGRITEQNWVQAFRKYPFDNCIFFPQTCSTCKFVRPARSKHCRLCGYCVSRFDHHCIWINNCVGEKNARYFLFFLFSTCQGLVQGCFITGKYVYVRRNRDIALIPSLWNSIRLHRAMGCMFLMSFLISPIVIAFLAFELWLIYTGMTTNESQKWQDIKHLVEDRKLYREVVNGKQRLYLLEDAPPNAELLTSMSQVDNIYDKGFKQNLYSVLTGN